MKNNYIVYMHISPSDKRYIGITCQNPEHRWNNGKGYSHNNYFTNAIEKYGWDNFEHIIIAKGLNEETAKWLEIELIREWNTINRDKGYNMTMGGDGVNGYKHTEKTKEKMSEIMSGENNPMFGTHHTEETKRKISNARTGICHTEETKERIRKNMSGENNHNFGKNFSKETRKKMSKSRKGIYCNEKHPRARKVICITTKRIFDTLKQGARFYGIKSEGDIGRCCKNKIKSCGKLKNGTPLKWKYLVWKHNKKYRIVD